MKQYLLPETGRFYKVNMHSHSVFSDGKQTPEEIKKVFMEKGYSAVAFTEHEMMFDFSELSDENFIAITSYEYAVNSKENPLSAIYEGAPVNFNHIETMHLNLYSKDPHDTRMVCYNPKYVWGNAKQYAEQAKYVGTPDYRRVYSEEGLNEIIRAARERDMLVVFNHPNWSLNNYSVYSKLEGLTGFEINNGGAHRGSDMDYAPHVYAELARAGKRMVCVAGDDNHSVHSCGLAWTMVKADSLTYENLLGGIEKGNCYASDGPEIYDLYVEDGKVCISCSDAVGIYFYTAGRRNGCALAGADGAPIRTATFTLKPEEDHFFRISVRDASGHHANTRYYYFDELTEQF